MEVGLMGRQEPNNVYSPIDALFLAEDSMKTELAKRDAAIGCNYC